MEIIHEKESDINKSLISLFSETKSLIDHQLESAREFLSKLENMKKRYQSIEDEIKAKKSNKLQSSIENLINSFEEIGPSLILPDIQAQVLAENEPEQMNLEAAQNFPDRILINVTNKSLNETESNNITNNKVSSQHYNELVDMIRTINDEAISKEDTAEVNQLTTPLNLSIDSKENIFTQKSTKSSRSKRRKRIINNDEEKTCFSEEEYSDEASNHPDTGAQHFL